MKISCLRTEAVHESISHALFNAPSYEIGDVKKSGLDTARKDSIQPS